MKAGFIIGLVVAVLMGCFAFVQGQAAPGPGNVLEGRVAPDAVDVSLVQLIATPERFHGKRVRVIGFVRLEFEGDAIYLHGDDYKHRLSRNGLWIDVPEKMEARRAEFDRRYVLIEGVFDAQNRGHLDSFSGSIRNLNRYMARTRR